MVFARDKVGFHSGKFVSERMVNPLVSELGKVVADIVGFIILFASSLYIGYSNSQYQGHRCESAMHSAFAFKLLYESLCSNFINILVLNGSKARSKLFSGREVNFCGHEEQTSKPMHAHNAI
jgi:hypothetical protein